MANPALIDELEKQFRDNPRRVFARLANEYRKSGDYMRAIEICHAHVPQQPGYISGHIVLGQALYDAGELDQAKETFQAALSLDPENLIALRQLGDISRTRRDFRDARGWYTRLLEVDPQNEEIVAQLGELALAEDSRGPRDGDSAAVSAEQLEERDGGVAVDTDNAPKNEADAGDDDLVSPEARAVVDMESDDPQPEPYAEDSFGFSGNGGSSPAPDLMTLDDDGDHEAETAFAPPEGLTIEDHGPALMAPDADDDEIAWIAAEGHASPGTGSENATPDEQDGTEFVVAAEASDEDPQSDAQNSDDFDFTFEPEEYEAPLRPHTGESLSIVAEEDALAGVHAGEWEERSPFGEPIGEDRPSEDSTSSFEPLPLSELDAAAGELPEMEALLIDVDGDAATPPVEQPQSAFDVGDHEGVRADVFDLSDAETLVEEESDAFAWGDSPTPASSEVVSEPAPSPPHSDDDALMDWEAVAESETVAGEPDVAAPGGDEPEPDESAASAFFVSAVAAGPGAGDESSADEAEELPVAAEESFDAERAEEPDEHLTSAEAEHHAEDAAAGAAAEPVGEAKPDATASAFVTETMAELYLQQGFRAEALDVYRRLAAQSPDDEALRERIADLEREAAPASSPASPNAVSPDHAPQQRTAAAFFRALASMPAPAVNAPAPPPAVSDFSAWIEDALSDAGDVSDEDDAAAAALASGFAADGRVAESRGGATRAAERDMSLNDVFGAEPVSGRTNRAGSLDAFLTPEGENASAPTGEEEGREDLEAFNAWLEGLKK